MSSNGNKEDLDDLLSTLVMIWQVLSAALDVAELEESAASSDGSSSAGSSGGGFPHFPIQEQMRAIAASAEEASPFAYHCIASVQDRLFGESLTCRCNASVQNKLFGECHHSGTAGTAEQFFCNSLGFCQSGPGLWLNYYH